ncbi:MULTISPECIES: hypothetical protein [Metabacillus]|uniref:Uncharacterized protein n=3 Tax=Metabacillus TaxID=2675233 RepID=A0A179SWB5_9BACI|nr:MULTISPECIES: hypothetical protein [Metabacillus]OAS86116.1 hypothetical protein A6K24_22600 [Metabacillus litoralis]QNF30552.1 hypothetical protein HUW50_25645 [Metabacillus sp. KUDC1714]
MLKADYQNGIIEKERRSNHNILQFIDGPGFDKLLQFLIRGLFLGMIVFCIPYFCFLLITCFF